MGTWPVRWAGPPNYAECGEDVNMSWDPTVWDVGLICGLALLTGGALAALAARQKQLIPIPVPKSSAKNKRGESDSAEPPVER